VGTGTLDKRIKRLISISLALIFAALSFAGCIYDTDSLYMLPELPGEYSGLQKLINQKRDQGWIISPPTNGSNIQPYLPVDFNGDGTDEYLVFFESGKNELTLMIYYQASSGEYRNYAPIIFADNAFDQVELLHLTSRKALVAVGTRSDSGKKTLQLYSDLGGRAWKQEYSNAYQSMFAVGDLNGDENDDLFSVSGNKCSLLSVSTEDNKTISVSAINVEGNGNIESMQFTSLSDGVPAFIVDVSSQNTMYSFVFSYAKSSLKWVNETSVEDTARPFTGLDGQLSSQIGGSAVLIPNYVTAVVKAAEEYVRTDWYQYSSAGERTLAASTYINNADGWYYILDKSWIDTVNVAKLIRGVNNGESVVSFQIPKDSGYISLLTIYTTPKSLLTSFGVPEERTVLYEGSTFVVSALITSELYTIIRKPSVSEVKNSFVIIPRISG